MKFSKYSIFGIIQRINMQISIFRHFYHQKKEFDVILTHNKAFQVIVSRYFWCLRKICVILKCKFVYSAARVSPYFFCQWFWFVLSVLVSNFSIASRYDQPLFFVGDVLENQSDCCKMLIILVQIFWFFSFAICNLFSCYFWCLM